jgi:hypothetical protein
MSEDIINRAEVRMHYDNAGDLKKKKGVKKFEISILGKVELQQVFYSRIPDTLNSSQRKTWEKDRDALIDYYLSYIYLAYNDSCRNSTWI